MATETKKATAKKATANGRKKETTSSASSAKIEALEASVAKLESYIRTFDMFLTNTMISNTVDPSANETLGEMAAAIE